MTARNSKSTKRDHAAFGSVAKIPFPHISRHQTLRHKRPSLKREPDTLKREPDTLKREPDTLKREPEPLKREPDTLKRERHTFLPHRTHFYALSHSFLRKNQQKHTVN